MAYMRPVAGNNLEIWDFGLKREYKNFIGMGLQSFEVWFLAVAHATLIVVCYPECTRMLYQPVQSVLVSLNNS